MKIDDGPSHHLYVMDRNLRYLFYFAVIYTPVYAITWILVFRHQFLNNITPFLADSIAGYVLFHTTRGFRDWAFLWKGYYLQINPRSANYKEMLEWLDSIDAKYSVVMPGLIKVKQKNVLIALRLMSD